MIASPESGGRCVDHISPLMEDARVENTKNTEKTEKTWPETASKKIRRRSDCPKFRVCKAYFCPLDPRTTDRKPRKNEVICFFLKEAATALGTFKLNHRKSSNQCQAEETRTIARSIRRTYYAGSPKLLRRFSSDEDLIR